MDNGSIHDYIYVKGHKPEVNRSLLWAQQIAEGMVTLHWKDRILSPCSFEFTAIRIQWTR